MCLACDKIKIRKWKNMPWIRRLMPPIKRNNHHRNPLSASIVWIFWKKLPNSQWTSSISPMSSTILSCILPFIRRNPHQEGTLRVCLAISSTNGLITLTVRHPRLQVLSVSARAHQDWAVYGLRMGDSCRYFLTSRYTWWATWWSWTRRGWFSRDRGEKWI